MRVFDGLRNCWASSKSPQRGRPKPPLAEAGRSPAEYTDLGRQYRTGDRHAGAFRAIAQGLYDSYEIRFNSFGRPARFAASMQSAIIGPGTLHAAAWPAQIDSPCLSVSSDGACRTLDVPPLRDAILPVVMGSLGILPFGPPRIIRKYERPRRRLQR